MPNNLDLMIVIRANSADLQREVMRARGQIARFEKNVKQSSSTATRAARKQNQLARATRNAGRAARESTSFFAKYRGAILSIAGAGIVRHAISTAASFEQLRLRLKVFEGDAATAATRFQELSKYAADTAARDNHKGLSLRCRHAHGDGVRREICIDMPQCLSPTIPTSRG